MAKFIHINLESQTFLKKEDIKNISYIFHSAKYLLNKNTPHGKAMVDPYSPTLTKIQRLRIITLFDPSTLC